MIYRYQTIEKHSNKGKSKESYTVLGNVLANASAHTSVIVSVN